MSRARADYVQKVRRFRKPGVSRRRIAPLLGDTRLSTLRIDALRWAIHTNQVTFPAQIPTFEKHDRADLQWKFALLYFIRGWNCEGIGAKYGLIHQRVRQVLNTWKRRAVEMGYIQFIPPVNTPVSVVQPTWLELPVPLAISAQLVAANAKYRDVPAASGTQSL
jgi:hypothetical protein